MTSVQRMTDFRCDDWYLLREHAKTYMEKELVDASSSNASNGDTKQLETESGLLDDPSGTWRYGEYLLRNVEARM